jgi:hypothetical protein
MSPAVENIFSHSTEVAGIPKMQSILQYITWISLTLRNKKKTLIVFSHVEQP